MDLFDTHSRLPPWWQRLHAAWQRHANSFVSPVGFLLGLLALAVALLSLIDLRLSLAAVALLIVLEIALSVLLPKPMRNHLYIPHASAKFVPTPEGTPGVSGPCFFTVNSLGVRGDEPPPGRRYTVYVCGGSTAIDLWLDQRSTWAFRLQEELSKRDGTTWVASIARPGIRACHTGMVFEGLMDDLPRADLLVNLAGVNDLQWGIRSSYDRDRPDDPCIPIFLETPGRLGQTGLGRLYYWMRERVLQRAPVQKTFDDLAHTAHRRSRQTAPLENYVDELPDITEALATYAHDIEVLIDLARRYGAPMLFLTQPTIWRADMAPEDSSLIFCGGVGSHETWSAHQRYYTTRALAEGMHRFNLTLIETCAKHGAPCYDLAADVPPVAANYFDDMHFSDAGAQLIARLIARAIERLGLLGQPGSARHRSAAD